MASAEQSVRNYVCGWEGCGKVYGKMFNLRKHQRHEGHTETETGRNLNGKQHKPKRNYVVVNNA